MLFCYFVRFFLSLNTNLSDFSKVFRAFLSDFSPQRYKKIAYTQVLCDFLFSNLLFCGLFLELADEFDGKEDQPVWGVLEQWCAEVVDYTWHIRFLATEHLLQSPFH